MAENTFLITIEQNLAATLIQKAASLPKNFNDTKFAQNCIAALKSIKDIEEVEPITVVEGLMKGAVLGLDFLNKECYLICRNKKNSDKKDAVFQTDYTGEKKLAKLYSIDPIADIDTQLVREGDFFEKKVIENKKIINFNPIAFNNGKIVGAFCIVTFKNGTCHSDDMGVEEMDKVRDDYSTAKDSPAWKKSPGEMYRKTVLRRTLKAVEKSFESPEQLRAYEESSDFDFNQQPLQLVQSPQVSNVFAKPATVPMIEAKPEPTGEPVAPAAEFICSNCGAGITEAENGYSKKNFKRALCRACQDAERGAK